MKSAPAQTPATTHPGDEDSLIDDFGLYIGRAMGWPPMAGRLAGVLMLSAAPMTMTELQETLGASKGSVSETTRLLITNGTVHRYKDKGLRHFVYQWRDDAWVGCLRHQRDSTVQLMELAATTLAHAKGLPRAQRARFQEMHDYYVFMVKRIEALLEEYQARWEADHA